MGKSLTEENRKKIIQFYDEWLKLPGMPEVELLTDVQVMELYRTLSFARWNLAYHCNECLKTVREQNQSLRESIKRIINLRLKIKNQKNGNN